MNEKLRQWLTEAEGGDLRPQVNRDTGINATWLDAEDAAALTPVLVDRFLQLKRPIADASVGGGAEMRLQDAGSFFYLIETLKRIGYEDLEQTLCVLLDEFAQLDEGSYDELYLWCIVELSRTDARHVDAYWPQVFALDRRYRAAAWSRPEGVALVDQPYRLTDLVFYFYVLYTIRTHPNAPDNGRTSQPPAGTPSLGSHLKRLAQRLGKGELEIVRRALDELDMVERDRSPFRWRPGFGDALGLLARRSPKD